MDDVFEASKVRALLALTSANVGSFNACRSIEARSSGKRRRAGFALNKNLREEGLSEGARVALRPVSD